MAIIGLLKEIEDEVTGAVSDWHVLESFYVNKSSKYSQATFATYVSRSSWSKGKQPVSRNISITINGVPDDMAKLETWLYEAAIEKPSPDVENPSALVGAEAVQG